MSRKKTNICFIIIAILLVTILTFTCFLSFEIRNETVMIEYTEQKILDEYVFNNFLMTTEQYENFIITTQPIYLTESMGIRFEAGINSNKCQDIIYLNGEMLIKDSITYDNISVSRGVFNETLVNYYNDGNLINIECPLAIQFICFEDDSNGEADDKNNINLIIETGECISSNSKSEILLSQRFVEQYGLDIDNLIGSKISYQINYEDYAIFFHEELLDNDNDAMNSPINSNAVGGYSTYEYGGGLINIFQDFEIIGVFNDSYLQYNGNSDFIININSFDEENIPVMIHYEIYDEYGSSDTKTIITYSGDVELIAQESTKNGTVFPFMLGNNYISISSYLDGEKFNLSPIIIVSLKYNNIISATKAYELYNEMINELPSQAMLVNVFSTEYLKAVKTYIFCRKIVIGICIVTLTYILLKLLYSKYKTRNYTGEG